MQLSMQESLPKLAQKHPYIRLPVTVFACVADVSIETIKCPIVAIENVAFFAINLLGALFHKDCLLLDAYKSLKISGRVGLVATPIVLVLSPAFLFLSLLINLPNSKEVWSFNLRAEEEANSPIITYDSKEFRALQKAIKAGNLDAIKRSLTNDILTNQSLAVALGNAAETGNLNAVELLLADSRLAKQRIGREVVIAAKKNHSELTKLLIQKLVQLNLNKTHSTIKEWQAEEAFFKKCLTTAKETAKDNGHRKLAYDLNAFL